MPAQSVYHTLLSGEYVRSPGASASIPSMTGDLEVSRAPSRPSITTRFGQTILSGGRTAIAVRLRTAGIALSEITRRSHVLPSGLQHQALKVTVVFPQETI